MKLILPLVSAALAKVAPVVKDQECTACEMYADIFDWSFCSGKINGNYPFNDDECTIYYNCWEGQTYCQECDIYKFDPYYEHQFIFDGEGQDDFGNTVMKGHCDFVGVDTGCNLLNVVLGDSYRSLE